VTQTSALRPGDADRDVCLLETRGRTTGEPRRIEIWFAADGDRVYLLSGGRDSAHWVRNLRAHPGVRVRLGRRWLAGLAREIEGDPDEMHARELLAAKYEGWRDGKRLSSWARESLPVAIDLSP
jgi:deazaflavin-dependent oxidoreductase (nitroreductase family)